MKHQAAAADRSSADRHYRAEPGIFLDDQLLKAAAYAAWIDQPRQQRQAGRGERDLVVPESAQEEDRRPPV